MIILIKHLRLACARGMGDTTFAEAYKELLDMSKEGLKTGREERDEKGEVVTRISESSEVAPASIIERLPWIVEHDNRDYAKIITIKDIRGILEKL